MKRLFQKIKALFIRIKPQFQATIETAVIVVQKVKDIINNPSVDILTALTPFEHDERILKALRSAIAYVSDVLSIADTSKSPSEQLQQIAAVLNQRHPQFKKLFYRELAASLAHALSDGKLTAWELFTLTQTAYKAIKENELDTSNIENESFEADNLEGGFELDAVFDKSVEELMQESEGKTITDGIAKDTSNE